MLEQASRSSSQSTAREREAHPAPTRASISLHAVEIPTHYSACRGDGVLRREKGAQNAESYRRIYAAICHSTPSPTFLERHSQLHRPRRAHSAAIRNPAWFPNPSAGRKEPKRGACLFRRDRWMAGQGSECWYCACCCDAAH